MPDQQATPEEAQRQKSRPKTTKAPGVDAETPAGENSSARAKPGQYLSFFLAGDEYAAGILQVREIIEHDTLTRVPLTPPWMRGVLNLRGGVVPVVDLAVKFGLPATETTRLTCIVIVEIELEGETTIMGVMVDEVSQVLDLSEDQIEPAPAFGTRVRTDFLLGMANVEDNLVLILDINRILALDELSEASSLGARREGTAERDFAAQGVDAEVAQTRSAGEPETHPEA